MPVSPRLTRSFCALAVLVALAGCDTLGGIGFGPSTPATPPGRALDYANDDLASLIFAVDQPPSLRPVPGGSVATLDASGAKGEKHFKGALALADGEAIDRLLPPAAAGRTYVLFGFAAKDKPALRDLQKWLKAQPDGASPVVVLQVMPKLCETAAVDPAATTYSILPALPGTALLPLVSQAPVGALNSGTAGQFPPCGST